MKTQTTNSLFIFLLLGLFTSLNGIAQEADSSFNEKLFNKLDGVQTTKEKKPKETQFFQGSFLPYIGTDPKRAEEIVYHLSINLFAGYTGGVNGLEMGAFCNLNRNNVNGIQLGGFGNVAGGDVSGLQMAGFANDVAGNISGLQMAGFSNVVREDIDGMQMAGFANVARGSVKGFQIAGFANVTNEMTGMQLAVVNKAERVKGLQFGIVNVADSVASGMQLGLINYSKDGLFSPALSYDDIVPYSVLLRTGRDSFYSIVSIGIKPDEYWSNGIGFGSRLWIGKKGLFLGPELMWEKLMRIKSDDEVADAATTQLTLGEGSHLTKLHFNFGYKLFRHLSLTAGPTVNLYTRKLSANGDDLITEIAKNPFYETKGAKNSYKMWVGYSIGVWF